MEISFHTTVARGLLSRVALITRMGTWAISGPGTALGWPSSPCLLERLLQKAQSYIGAGHSRHPELTVEGPLQPQERWHHGSLFGFSFESAASS